MTSPVLELIYWTNPVTAGDGDDNRAGSHTRQEIEKDSQSVQALWVTELRGNVSISFGVSVSLSGSPPPQLSLSLPCRVGVRAGNVSVRRCVKWLRDGTVIQARFWVGGWSGIISGCEFCEWGGRKRVTWTFQCEADWNISDLFAVYFCLCVLCLDRKKSTFPPWSRVLIWPLELHLLGRNCQCTCCADVSCKLASNGREHSI